LSKSGNNGRPEAGERQITTTSALETGTKTSKQTKTKKKPR